MEQTPLHDELGVRITGVDFQAPLTDETVTQIRAAIDAYSFVWFPDQSFDDDRQLALTQALGNPEPSHVALDANTAVEYFGTIGNVQPDGTVIGNNHKTTIFKTGNNMWHSDASFKSLTEN